MTLYFECRINKIALLLAILPTGCICDSHDDASSYVNFASCPLCNRLCKSNHKLSVNAKEEMLLH